MKKEKLGNIIDLKYGKGLPEDERIDGSYPVYGSSGIVGYHNKFYTNGPGIIVGRKGSIGAVYWSNDDFFPIDTVYYVDNKADNDLKYLYYLLTFLPLDKQNSDVAVPGLNRSRALSFSFYYEDNCLKQNKIAGVIFTYDDLIDTNRRRIQLLEEAARLLFREWFVYFRFPGHEKVKIVDGVPEGWSKGNIQDISKVKSGYAFDSKDWLDEGNPVIKIGNIVGDGSVNLDDCSFIDQDVAVKAKDFSLKKGDLLIAMTGATIGKVGLLSENSKTVYLNQRVGKFIPKFEGAELILYCFFMSNTAQNQITNYASGAAQPNISASQIESIKIIVATRNFYNQFIDLVGPIFEEILNLRIQNQKLAQARDLLLPRLMNGEIEV